MVNSRVADGRGFSGHWLQGGNSLGTEFWENPHKKGGTFYCDSLYYTPVVRRTITALIAKLTMLTVRVHCELQIALKMRVCC